MDHVFFFNHLAWNILLIKLNFITLVFVAFLLFFLNFTTMILGKE
jgi:hypothetical protein